jgi:hypothetical protein
LWERIEPDFIRAVSGITLSRAAEG